MTRKKKPFENIVRKGENAGNQHFLIFPQCFFATNPKKKFCFKLHLFCRLQVLSIWTSLKICRLVKEQRLSRYQDFCFSPTMFSKDSSSGRRKSSLCGKKLTDSGSYVAQW